MISGTACPLIYEPWLCEPCLLYSLRACRGLRAMRRKQTLTVWRVRSAQFVPTLERPVTPPARGPAAATVVTYIKLAITDGTELHPYDVFQHAKQTSAAAGSSR